jgi:hypothetical protein
MWSSEMVRWEKCGRIFVPDGSIPWMRTHATLPVAVPLDDAILRILFAGRDEANRSRIGWIDVDARDPGTVLGISKQPVLPLGERGTFDDNGMTPSVVVQHGPLTYMYYIGWNPQVIVPPVDRPGSQRGRRPDLSSILAGTAAGPRSGRAVLQHRSLRDPRG